MNSFDEHLAQDRRRSVLELLEENEGTLNEGVLKSGLDLLGHRRLSREEIRADLRFLINAGLIIDEWAGDVMVCSLTHRGVEAAQGLIDVEGIKSKLKGV